MLLSAQPLWLLLLLVHLPVQVGRLCLPVALRCVFRAACSWWRLLLLVLLGVRCLLLPASHAPSGFAWAAGQAEPCCGCWRRLLQGLCVLLLLPRWAWWQHRSVVWDDTSRQVLLGES